MLVILAVFLFAYAGLIAKTSGASQLSKKHASSAEGFSRVRNH
jgi:hypothetical protein